RHARRRRNQHPRPPLHQARRHGQLRRSGSRPARHRPFLRPPGAGLCPPDGGRPLRHPRQAGEPRPRARPPAPAMPQPDQVEAKKRLESLSGTAFNTEYLAVQLADHQKTAHLLEWEINAGQDPAVQQLAKDALPVVLEHLRQVQALIAETSGAPPQGLAAASPVMPANRR
ncbi:DUF4142 domain-containing protein, partial [Azoarcus sp. TTM-91]|nr:DUF4142 domain-containing protein [Azoarcus sp. TTM-91]